MQKAMQKTILITGSTDGIGLETAKLLAEKGHTILLHGRNPEKLAAAEDAVAKVSSGGKIESFVADLSNIKEVTALANAVIERHDHLDVLINNAGIFKVADSMTSEGFDVRFVVNTIAPYLLTQKLLSLLPKEGWVVNLSSAAQESVDLDALSGKQKISEDFSAYAQSKLALTMWSHSLGLALKDTGPTIVAVNPGSLLGSKMVKEGFGVAGGDIRIGADILARAAFSEEFANASGQYFDNDSGQFAQPQADAQNLQKCDAVIAAIEAILDKQAE